MARSLFERARQRLAGEIGTISKDHGGRLRIALAYPNTYHVGMSNLGFQSVYWLFNQRPDTVCERVFLPDPDELRQLRRTRQPLCSIESQTPLYEFDVVAFSLTYELDYPHALTILSLGGVPLLANERDERHPMVIAGGPCPTFNPEPMADFVDLFVIGDGEQLIGPFTFALGTGTGLPRKMERIVLGQLPGLYAPSLQEVYYHDNGTIAQVITQSSAPKRIKRQVTRPLDRWETCSHVLTRDTTFGDMFLIEISRGCGRGCRFCVADYAYRPLRRRSVDSILRTARRGLEHRDTSGLIGAAVSDYPEIDRLCAELMQAGARIAVASLRADSLTPGLLEALARSGTVTLTLAPEAGTERLRAQLHKTISDEQLFTAARAISKLGIRQLKLYFMVGLPGETEADIAAIPDLVRRIKQAAQLSRVSVAVSAFVPKPGTPLERTAMALPLEIKRKLAIIQSELAGESWAELGGETEWPSFLQGVLARGDRRVGSMMLEAWQAGGSKSAWRKALGEAGVWYACREREAEEQLPWSHLVS